MNTTSPLWQTADLLYVMWESTASESQRESCWCRHSAGPLYITQAGNAGAGNGARACISTKNRLLIDYHSFGSLFIFLYLVLYSSNFSNISILISSLSYNRIFKNHPLIPTIISLLHHLLLNNTSLHVDVYLHLFYLHLILYIL